MAMVKIKRAHVIILEELIKEIDRLVGQRKRSQFISEAVKKELNRLRFLAGVRETSGAWKAENHSEQTSKWVETIRREDGERFKDLIHG